MKNILTIAFILISTIGFSQSASDYHNLLKEINITKKSFGNGGGFHERYYPELKNILDKSSNWRNLNSTEIKNVISQMENLKKDYLKPDGAYKRYLKDVNLLNTKIEDINKLAIKYNLSKINKQDSKKTATYLYLNDHYDTNLTWLKEHLEYKLEKEKN